MLCLFINHARVNSSRLIQILHAIGLQAIGETFHPTSNARYLQKHQDTITKYSNATPDELNSKNFNSVKTIRETLHAFSKSNKPFLREL